MATRLAELYEDDFYAWTQQQAQTLRAHFKGDNRIDVEHLAEEVEDLGKSQLQSVESYIQQIIAHLLKLDYSGYELPRRHWRSEIVAFRNNMERKISPSMRPKLRQALPELYEGGRRLAAASLDAEPDLERVLPRHCPYDWAAVTERDVRAETAIELPGRDEPAKQRRKGKA
jgi:Domain of unknown function DUF29